MFGFRKDERTDRERYLEDELDRARQAEERSVREDQERREARRRENRERMEEEMRSAEGWLDALGKQSSLCWREFVSCPDPDETEDTDFFAQSSKACDAALELWREEAAKRQSEIDELHQRLDAIQGEIRHAVADRLDGQRDSQGWRSVVNALRDDDTEPSAWLNW